MTIQKAVGFIFADDKDELFFVIGERSSGQWEFHERNSWETMWKAVPTVQHWIDKAEQTLREDSSPPLENGRKNK